MSAARPSLPAAAPAVPTAPDAATAPAPPAPASAPQAPLPRSSFELVTGAATGGWPTPRRERRAAAPLLPAPTDARLLLRPALEQLAREAVLHRPTLESTAWDTTWRAALTRLAGLRRVALAGSATTTDALLFHLAADAALARGVPTALAWTGVRPGTVMRRLLAWHARLDRAALEAGALDDAARKAIGRAATRLGAGGPLVLTEGHRRGDRLARELEGALRWLLDQAGVTRARPGLLALSLHAAPAALTVSAPELRDLFAVLREFTTEPRLRLLVTLPWEGARPSTPPFPALPLGWRAMLDGTGILTGWPIGSDPTGGLTLHLERHVDGAALRAHAERHPSGRLLAWAPPPVRAL